MPLQGTRVAPRGTTEPAPTVPGAARRAPATGLARVGAACTVTGVGGGSPGRDSERGGRNWTGTTQVEVGVVSRDEVRTPRRLQPRAPGWPGTGEVGGDGHSNRGASSAQEGAWPRVSHHAGQHGLPGGAGHGAESVSDHASDQAAALGGHVKKKEGPRETAEGHI